MKRLPPDPPRDLRMRYVFLGRRLPERHAAWVHHDVQSRHWRSRQVLVAAALALGTGGLMALLLALYLGGISVDARPVMAQAVVAPIIVFFGRSEGDARRVLSRHQLRADGHWEPHPPRFSRAWRTFTTILGIGLLAGTIGYTVVNRDLIGPGGATEQGCTSPSAEVEDGIVRFSAVELGLLRAVRAEDRTFVATLVEGEVAEWWVLHDVGDEVQALNEPAKRVTPHLAVTPVDETQPPTFAEQRALAASCASAAGLPEGGDR